MVRNAFMGALALACMFLGPPPAKATDANACGYAQGPGGWYSLADRSGPYALGANCGATLLGSAGGSQSNPVYGPAPSNLVTGQVVIAVTGTAVQFSAGALVNGFVVKSKATNNAACAAVGGSSVAKTYDGTGNGYGVCPGEAASFATNNASNIWVNGTAGDIFTGEGN